MSLIQLSEKEIKGTSGAPLVKTASLAAGATQEIEIKTPGDGSVLLLHKLELAGEDGVIQSIKIDGVDQQLTTLPAVLPELYGVPYCVNDSIIVTLRNNGTETASFSVIARGLLTDLI